jgi:hypothetical protein
VSYTVSIINESTNSPYIYNAEIWILTKRNNDNIQSREKFRHSEEKDEGTNNF